MDVDCSTPHRQMHIPSFKSHSQSEVSQIRDHSLNALNLAILANLQHSLIVLTAGLKLGVGPRIPQSTTCITPPTLISRPINKTSMLYSPQF